MSHAVHRHLKIFVSKLVAKAVFEYASRKVVEKPNGDIKTSYYLFHWGEERDVRISCLEDCLNTAAVFGWEPMGTLPPVDDWEPWIPEEMGEWGGWYCVNARQIVTADDAHNLSQALCRALDAITIEKDLAEEQEEVVEPLRRYSTWKELIQEIADFAAEGQFWIC